MTPRLLHAVVSRSVGLLLLAAAGLKAYGLSADPVARMGIFSVPEFQLAVIQFEVFLGLWLLWGIQPLGSWAVALVTFAGFAGVSLYQVSVGQSSCGCFGRLAVSPWYALGLDVIVLAGLVVGRPDLAPLRDGGARKVARVVWPAACGLAGVVAISGVLFGLAHFGFGSVPAAVAFFRGERVSVEPRLLDVGEGAVGEARDVSVTLTNWTDRPIQLFGGTADCSCSVLHDLPLTIPAKESRTVRVHMRLSGPPGVFTRKATFLIDDEGFKKIDFRLTGRLMRAAG
jgi:hypothetical protein